MLPLESAFAGAVPQTIGQLLQFRARRDGAAPAVTHLHSDGRVTKLTFAELLARAEVVASALTQIGPPGCRALLLFPPGSEFLIGFYGASLAGWTPVPTCFPKPGRAIPRLDSIAADCQPAALLAPRETIEQADTSRWHPIVAALPQIATDAVDAFNDQTRIDHTRSAIDRGALPLDDSLGLLQYTSGSTSQPRGARITHANLMSNLEAIRHGFGNEFHDYHQQGEANVVTWLPAFHDMGLIGGLLSPLYAGMQSVIMSPSDFLARPARWLQAVSDYRARVTGAPNFAYQLCVDRVDGAQIEGLDLSSLQIAFCGAEPIQARTFESFASRFAHVGFSYNALLPCYGLAEATLFVTGSRLIGETGTVSLDRQSLAAGQAALARPEASSRDVVRCVTSGPPAIKTDVRIVNPESRLPVPESVVGEIWVSSPSVADGYWNRGNAVAHDESAADTTSDQSVDRFQGRLGGEHGGPAQAFLRTGDLGFLREGRLYVTGRLKDLIILRGRNHYPQDIEISVRQSMGNDGGTVAAFAASGPHGEGLAIVAETARTTDANLLPGLVREIRRAVIDAHEIDPRHIVLVRPASIPMTTSGKIQRSACRDRWEQGAFTIRHRWDRADVRVDGEPMAPPSLPSPLTSHEMDNAATAICAWIVNWMASRAGLEPDQVDPTRPLEDSGLDSFTAVELSGEVEDWLGLRLTPDVAFHHPSPHQLSRYLAAELIKLTDPAASR